MAESELKTVAVVGATGAVGEVVLRLLAERNFPVGELRPLASSRSAGSTVSFAGREIEVQEATPDAFDGVDFAFFAATGSLSKTLAPEVAKRGGVAIDKSSTWRLDEQVPLVVPEINPDALEKQPRHRRVPELHDHRLRDGARADSRGGWLGERRRHDPAGGLRNREAGHRGTGSAGG